jgi:signal transduction histidine kinase
MSEVAGASSDELRRCLRDIFALTALPTTWASLAPREIAQSLADALRSALRAELVYVRLSAAPGGEPIEVARSDLRPEGSLDPRAIGSLLASSLEVAGAEGRDVRLSIPHPVGPGVLPLAVAPLGPGGEVGVVAVGAERPGFPGDIDRALLRAGANQAAISVRNAQYVAQLREAARHKDEFLAMLGHELRSPLASILSAAELVRMDAEGSGSAAPVAEIVERQALHMARLIEDLLDAARMTHGKVSLRKELVELATVVASAVEMVRPLVDQRGHDLAIELPSSPVRLEADAARLQQILGNLLGNAVKYSEPGGTIRLSAERRGTDLVIRINDKGIGIARDLLPRIFEPFVQAERASAGPQGGLGIGLALVRTLVELHGGRVNATSDGAGMGSEFTVWLPLPL